MTVVLLYTGIDDLADVKRLLKIVNDWQSLGLDLGLLYTTLKRMEEGQQRVISAIQRCWQHGCSNRTMLLRKVFHSAENSSHEIVENELADEITI